MPQTSIDIRSIPFFVLVLFGCLFNLSSGVLIGSILNDIVGEKERGVTDMLNIMGVSSTSFWVHWFITHFILVVIQSFGYAGVLILNNLVYKTHYMIIYLHVLIYLVVNFTLYLDMSFLFLFSFNISKEAKYCCYAGICSDILDRFYLSATSGCKCRYIS